MKIKVCADGFRLSLWLPLSILKSRVAYNCIVKNIKRRSANYNVEPATENTGTVTARGESPLTREQMKIVHGILKDYVKTHGHFALVDVEASDGTKVKIDV